MISISIILLDNEIIADHEHVNYIYDKHDDMYSLGEILCAIAINYMLHWV